MTLEKPTRKYGIEVKQRKEKPDPPSNKSGLPSTAYSWCGSLGGTFSQNPPGSRLVGCVVFLVTLAVYIRTLQPAVAGGDSGELMAVAHELGTAHPPGYPLFTMFSKFSEVAFTKLSQNELSNGQAMNLGHAILSAFAVTFLYYAGLRLTGSNAAGLLAAGMFAFSPAVWLYAVVTEVFPLNNFFVCLLLLLCVEYYNAVVHQQQHGEGSRVGCVVYLSSLVCGLASTNQHTIALYLIPIVPWVFVLDWRHLSFKRFMFSTLAYSVGVSPYLYLIWSAVYVKSAQSWGDMLSFAGLKTHLLREEYGTFSLASKEAPYRVKGFALLFSKYFADVREQTLSYCWCLGVIGLLLIVVKLCRQRSLVTILNVEFLFLAMYAFYLCFFHSLANLPLDNPLFVGVVQRFWIQPLSLLFLFIAVGFAFVENRAVRLCSSYWRGYADFTVHLVTLSCAVGIVAMQCGYNFPIQDQSGNYIVRDFGRAILHSLPNNSLLLTKGDLMINSARYVQTLEGFRRDIRIADLEMMTYYWYIRNLRHNYPELIFPRDKDFYFPGKPRGFTIKDLLDLNMPHRHVFLCGGWKEGDHSFRGWYTTRPWGVASQIVREPVTYTLKSLRKYVNKTHEMFNVSVQLPQAGHRFPPHSWELVVLGDYWNAYANHALYLMQEAEKSPPSLVKDSKNDGMSKSTVALQRAIEMYEHVFEHQYPHPPAFVCRNLGVTIQNWLRQQPNEGMTPDQLPNIVLLRDAFARYLQIVAAANATDRVEGGAQQVQVAIEYYDNVIDSFGGDPRKKPGGGDARPKRG